MNKLTDYGILVLTHAAREPFTASLTARDLAERSRVPLPTVSKILKELHHAGIVESHRGIKGGYRLAREPRDISLAEVVQALEGPIALTECSGKAVGTCELEPGCLVRNNWRVITAAVRNAFEEISLAQLAAPLVRPTLNLSAPRAP